MTRILKFLGLLAAFLLLLLLVVPLFLPQSGSGTLDYRESAGPDAVFVDVDGLDVHVLYREYTGTNTNPPLIVLLHGFGANVHSWRDVMVPLNAFGNVLAYDRPAFGWTQRDAAGLAFDPYSEAGGQHILTSLITHFASDSDSAVVLVGHSAGGGVATAYALADQQEISALILVAPAIQLPGNSRPALGWLARIPQVRRTAVWLFGEFTTSGLALLELSWHDSSRLTPEVIDLYTRPTEIEGWELALWQFATAPRGQISDAQLASLGPPVLVITGDDDRVVATVLSIELAGKIPGARLELIANSGHLPQEETPDAFMQAVTRHWGQLLR